MPNRLIHRRAASAARSVYEADLDAEAIVIGLAFIVLGLLL
jgi:hypothetical protein